MTRKTLALVLPALLLVVALMAGTTMAMQITKVKPDTPGTVIIKETIPLKLKTLPPVQRIDSFVLSPYSGVLIGPFTLSSGQELGVYVTWSPSSATILVGVVNAQTGSGYGVYVSGGSVFVIFNPGPGQWYVFIFNPNSYSVTINQVIIWILES
ncbi:MAG: hypothetical protein RXQ95_06265 [Vulcanisaeta sp.]